MRLKPMFSYYGSKWRLAPTYPSPLYNTIVEPFAGSACYALLHFHKDVILIDKNDIICGVWDYLINATETEIRKLPLLKCSQPIPTSLPVEARWLIGFWTSKGTTRPGKTMHGNPNAINMGCWSAAIRERIASQLKYIRHWVIKQMCYTKLNNEPHSYFIDPPYVKGGDRYTENSIDYPSLGEWCRSRKGQVIVCENGSAKWLPFRPHRKTKGTRKDTTERIWTNLA